MKTITISLLIFLLNSLLPAQDIKLETLEDKWGIIPIIAVDQNKNGVTNLTKPNLEILINRKNIRDFLLLKKNFLSGPTAKTQLEIPPGGEKRKTIYFIFDTIFTSRNGISKAKILARNLIQRFKEKSNIAVLTIHPLKGLNYITGPLRDKKFISQKIENEVIWPYGTGISKMDQETRTNKISKALQTLCQEILEATELEFVFLLSKSTSRTKNGGDISQKPSKLFTETVDYLKQCNAMMFFLNLSDHGLSDPSVRETTNLLSSLSKASRTLYLEGVGDTIFKKVIQMMEGYYEITYPKLVKFTNPNRQMIIKTNRQNVFIHTLNNITSTGLHSDSDFIKKAKTKKKGLKKYKKNINENKSNISDQSETLMNKNISITTGFFTPILEKVVNNILVGLSKNRFNLELTTSKYYCGLAQVSIQQGQFEKAGIYLNKILQSTEKNTGFIKDTLQELDGVLKVNRTLEKILGNINLYEKKYYLKNQKKLYTIVRESQGYEKKTLKPLRKIMKSAENHNRFVEQIIEELILLVFNRQADFENESKIYKKKHLSESRAALNQKKLDILLMPSKNNLARSYVKKSLLDSLRKKLTRILSRANNHIKFVQNILKESGQSQKRETINFVVRYSRQFPREFKVDYFRKKLLELQVSKKLIQNRDFIYSLLPAQKFYLNNQGYLEALYHNHTVMVYIPEGEFKMGMPWEGGAQDESPEHPVYLDGYWISKHEINFGQFDKYCEETGEKKPLDNGFGRGRHPVINISWHDAANYCKWLSRKVEIITRLPSEAEWEKAARGNKKYKYPWGNEKPDSKKANFADINLLYHYERNNPPASEKEHQGNLKWMDRTSDDNYIYTAPVGKFSDGISPYGVLDMAGNVWEIVHDWYDGDYYQKSPYSNPRGPIFGTYKITRGGGWDSHSWMLRSTTRAGGDPHKGSDTLGFRIVFGKER